MFHSTKEVLWHIAQKRMLEDRAAMSRDEGDAVREYKPMHEGTFLRSRLTGGHRRQGRRSGGNDDGKEDLKKKR